MMANLVLIGILAHYDVSVGSQYSVRFLWLCEITNGQTIHLPIEGLMSPVGTQLN